MRKCPSREESLSTICGDCSRVCLVMLQCLHYFMGTWRYFMFFFGGGVGWGKGLDFNGMALCFERKAFVRRTLVACFCVCFVMHQYTQNATAVRRGGRQAASWKGLRERQRRQCLLRRVSHSLTLGICQAGHTPLYSVWIPLPIVIIQQTCTNGVVHYVSWSCSAVSFWSSESLVVHGYILFFFFLFPFDFNWRKS